MTSLPYDNDQPLSLTQLLKQSMRSVDTLVKDNSLLDKMSTHFNGLLRQKGESEADKTLAIFNKIFKNAEKAMVTEEDKQVLSVLKRQVTSFIGVTLKVEQFLELEENDDSSSDEEESSGNTLSWSDANKKETENAWNESKAYYDSQNIDIFSSERAQHEKFKQQEEQLAREFNQPEPTGEIEEGSSGESSSSDEEVVEEVQVKSRGMVGEGDFTVVRQKKKKSKKQTIQTNFTYSKTYDNNRADNYSSTTTSYSRTSYNRPPAHRIRVSEFRPKYLERTNQDIFCMPLFFPSEESYRYFHSALSTAQKTLYVCVYSITDNDTADVLINAKKRGVDVRVITDNDQMDACKGSDVVRLNERFGIPFKHDNSDQFMHNKFAVMDGKTVITGSFNWSLGARYKNNENIIITNIPSVVREFANEFDELWRHY